MASRSYTSRSKTTLTPSQESSYPSSSSSSQKRKIALPSSQESSYPSTSASARKRKATSYLSEEEYPSDSEFAISKAQDTLAGLSDDPPTKKKHSPKKEKDEEKRLKRFRQKPPQSYLERLSRVRSQRMFLIDRNRSMSGDGMNEEEVFDIAGSTGNIYQVRVGRVPSCSCPDAGKGNQCKHIIYVSISLLLLVESEG
jgi:hypothetical protein